ncbi:MAG: hypothetical protein OXF26_09860 [Alphaproteobacteria bacterium]|nr:hypothetical protein [Alphaproteobacteria bacterium]MCY4231157.1 hypothetical protein [Alphaproteobacteria bacterium]
MRKVKIDPLMKILRAGPMCVEVELGVSVAVHCSHFSAPGVSCTVGAFLLEQICPAAC